MYRLYELYGANWVRKVSKETLKEISSVLHDKVNKSECSHFRIDVDEIPLMIIENNEYQFKHFRKNIERTEQLVLRKHRR